MKNLFVRSTLVAILGLSLFLFSACSEENEPGNKGEETIIPDVLDMPIVGTLSVSTIDPEDTISITLNEKPNKTKVINRIPYRAIIDDVEIVGGHLSTTSFSADSLTLYIIPDEVLPGAQSLMINVSAHWEWKLKTSWETILWEDELLEESYNGTFTTTPTSLVFSNEDLEYTYPIANQYHFLIDESNGGFVKLRRANKHIFNLAGYEFKVQFLNDLDLIIERDVAYNNETKTISYEIPGTLDLQMIYNFRLIARNLTTLEETDMVNFHFRTSKYRDFTTKFNSIVYTGSVFSILVDNFRGHYLYQIYSSAGEYYDDFEIGDGQVTVKINSTHQVPYGNNLIRFKANLQGVPWYEESLYPWLYAPWTESSFNPVLSRSTSIVGSPPLEAMSLYNSGSGKLTQAMIDNNSAPSITNGTNSSISFNLPVIINQDFVEIQAQASAKYLQVEILQPREQAILFNSMPPISAGTYPYQVNYTLPNGVITTSLEKSMTY